MPLAKLGGDAALAVVSGLVPGACSGKAMPHLPCCTRFGPLRKRTTSMTAAAAPRSVRCRCAKSRQRRRRRKWRRRQRLRARSRTPPQGNLRPQWCRAVCRPQLCGPACWRRRRVSLAHGAQGSLRERRTRLHHRLGMPCPRNFRLGHTASHLSWSTRRKPLMRPCALVGLRLHCSSAIAAPKAVHRRIREVVRLPRQQRQQQCQGSRSL
mmetsp:Transcript_124346/g.264953  ORF Transcript_124346/g.264953 Transcript_124346/m.264953 type:complete len:210 (-) Transcript_124346:349-978(-)